MPFPLVMAIFGVGLAFWLIWVIYCISQNEGEIGLIAVALIVLVLVFSWGFSGVGDREIIQTPVEVHTVDGVDVVVWKDKVYNINQYFGRDFLEGDKIIVTHSNGYWSNGVYYLKRMSTLSLGD